MIREWNQSADRLASEALQHEKGTFDIAEENRQNLITLNRLHELLRPNCVDRVVKVAEITRFAVKRRQPPEVLQEEIVQQVRIDRIKQAQDEERWIVNLKTYLIGDVTKLTADEAKSSALIAQDYEVDESGLLFFCPSTTAKSDDRMEVVRLVVPELLQQDFLHHYHVSLEGGH